MSSPSFGIEIVGDGIGARAPAELARRLDAAGVSYWVIGAGRDEPVHSVNLDPTVIATIAARHSRELGVVVAAAAHRDHPYNLARRLLSVDHAAQGRAGWLTLEADRRIALNALQDSWTQRSLDPAHTTDAVAAVRALWRTWPLSSVIADHETGVFADTSQIRRADVRNTYRISGPMNVPGSVQGDLPVWAGPGVGGADLVVIDHGDPLPEVPAVVRVRGAERLTEALNGLSAPVAGILARVGVHELDRVLDEILPVAHQRGLIGTDRRGTLRQRLGTAVPLEPDLSTKPLAFSGAVNPGGRL